MFKLNEDQTDGFGVPGRERDRDGKVREVFLSDGVTAKIEVRDPYGFWYIAWTNGRTPKELADATWTSASDALKALERYVTENKYKVEISDTPIEKVVLKRKNS
jgi:hypothetical protein